jgi:hypothetical protein
MGTRFFFVALCLLLSAAPALAQVTMSDREQAAADVEMARRTGMILPGIESWRFADTGDQRAIWMDVVWIGRDLDKPATEVRGDLLFYDLTGRLRFGLAVDLQQPIERNDAVAQTGVGVRYDDTRADHQWLQSTPVASMLIDFRVKRVLFSDGELLEF